VFPLKSKPKNKNCRKATQFLLLLLAVILYLFKSEFLFFFICSRSFPICLYNPDPAMTTFALFNPTYGVVTWMRLFIIIIIIILK